MELEDLYIHAGNKFRIRSILRGFACTYNKMLKMLRMGKINLVLEKLFA